MTINLYFGDNNYELAEKAVLSDPQAFLIDHSNYEEFINNPPIGNVTVYTSLGDLPKVHENNVVVYNLLDLADNIYYHPPTVWSNNNVKKFTERILEEFKLQKNNVHNYDLSFDVDLYTKLIDIRKTEDPQLWIAGASIVYGWGVESSQRYGQLVADSLGLKVSFLADSGASISWAVDQIVRSDIRPNDIVMLALNEEFKFSYWCTNNTVWHIDTKHRQFSNRLAFTNLSSQILDRLITDDNCVYQSMIRVHQLVNFCRKLDVKLLLMGGLGVSSQFAFYLEKIPEFVNYFNFKSGGRYVDLGSDGRHPGPQQHQLYADFCQSALKKLNYI